MRIFLLCILLNILWLPTACKKAPPPNPYSYQNSAFSIQPGEAWSGDTKAMLKDMSDVLESGNYGTLSPTKDVSGFSTRLTLCTVLRPLTMQGPQGQTVYALETTAMGTALANNPHAAIREIFTRKYTTYTVLPARVETAP